MAKKGEDKVKKHDKFKSRGKKAKPELTSSIKKNHPKKKDNMNKDKITIPENSGKKRARNHGDNSFKKDSSLSTAPGSSFNSALPPKKKKAVAAQQALPIWESLRVEKDKNKRQALVEKLFDIFGTADLHEYAVKHETSRIIQWMIKCGSQKQIDSCMDVLVPHIVEFAGDKYAHHLAMAILRSASSKTKLEILQTVQNDVVSMLRNSYAADVLDFVYQVVATKQEQRFLLLLQIFRIKNSGLLDNILAKYRQQIQQVEAKSLEKKDIMNSFRDIVNETDRAFQDVLVESVGKYLESIADKRFLLKNIIIHRALREYLEYLHQIKDKISVARDFATLFVESTPSIFHTKDGALFSVRCAALLDAKGRKKMLKSYKSLVLRGSQEEYGHWVILALLNFTDDTKNTAQSILKELCHGQWKEVCFQKFSRLILLNLFAPYDTHYFHPEIYGWFQNVAENSFKDPDTRQKELLLSQIDGFVDFACENMKFMINNPVSQPLILESLSLLKFSDMESYQKRLLDAFCAFIKETINDDKQENEEEEEENSEKAGSKSSSPDALDRQALLGKTIKTLLRISISSDKEENKNNEEINRYKQNMRALYLNKIVSTLLSPMTDEQLDKIIKLNGKSIIFTLQEDDVLSKYENGKKLKKLVQKNKALYEEFQSMSSKKK